MLINFRVEFPSRFRPKLQAGFAIAGICLIRLEEIRPKAVPDFLGISSENGAHRVAVLWDDGGHQREGVYISRRDTSSLINHFAGGRLFPGEHHHADFDVKDDGDLIDLSMRARDDGVSVEVRARNAPALPASSVFKSLEEVSNFFEAGSVGYSVTRDEGRLDGIKLKTQTWKVSALAVEQVRSSVFADEAHYPTGSVEFDCGLLMRDIEHEWQHEPDLSV
jgi:hypothetical protein